MAKRVIYVEVDANLAPYLEKIARAQSELVKFGATSDRVGAGVRKNASDMDILATSFKRFGAIAAASGLTGLVVGLGKAVIEVDRLNIAMQNITESTRGYAKSQQFLNSLTNDYGQAMVSTQRNYNQFIASSNASNLSLESRQKIFQSIIKAGSALQLSNYSMEKSLYAVNQMFSKNAVQAEELRQQLGDHLPGAMSLMAQALGVSEKALMGMMKKGLVPATEALPKFAALLEELYGSTAARNLETVSGAWNRLYNSVIKAAVGVNEQYGVTKALASVLNDVASNLSTYSQGISLVIAGVVAYKVAVLALNAAMALWNRYAVQSTAIEITKLSAIRASAAATAAATAATAGYTAATGAATIATRALSFAMAAIPIIAAIAAISLLASHFSEYNKTVSQSAKEQKDLDDSVKSYTASTQKQEVRLQSLTNIINSTTSSLKMKEDAFNSLKALFPEQFKGLQKYAGNEAKVKEAIDATNKSLRERISTLAATARADTYQQKAVEAYNRLKEIQERLPIAGDVETWRRDGLSFILESEKQRLTEEMHKVQSDLSAYTSMLGEEEKKIMAAGGRISEAMTNIPVDNSDDDDSKIKKAKDKMKKHLDGVQDWYDKQIKYYYERQSKMKTDFINTGAIEERISRVGQNMVDIIKAEKKALENMRIALHGGPENYQSMLKRMDIVSKFSGQISSNQPGGSGNAAGNYTNTANIASLEFNKSVEKIKEQGEGAIKTHIVESLGDAWAAAFESIFNKDINFGQAMKKMLGEFMKGLGQILVRMGASIALAGKLKATGETSLSLFGGGAGAIAGGLAMVALGGALMGGGSAISASAGRSAATGGVSGSAAGAGYSGITYQSSPKIQVVVSGQMTAKGTDLVGVIRTTNQLYGNG